MASAAQPRISPAEYIALEQQLGVKHEYHDGLIFAMSGVSLPHGRIQMNLSYRVTGALLDSACNAFPSDVRVVIEAADMATYPGLSIVCGEPRQSKSFKHSVVNPTVLFEVLSPSTERYDRVTKFDQYRKLESLREYVLISQESMSVDLYRLENGHWTFYPMRGADALLSLASADIEIPLSDIYRGVNFEDAEKA